MRNTFKVSVFENLLWIFVPSKSLIATVAAFASFAAGSDGNPLSNSSFALSFTWKSTPEIRRYRLLPSNSAIFQLQFDSVPLLFLWQVFSLHQSPKIVYHVNFTYLKVTHYLYSLSCSSFNFLSVSRTFASWLNCDHVTLCVSKRVAKRL